MLCQMWKNNTMLQNILHTYLICMLQDITTHVVHVGITGMRAAICTLLWAAHMCALMWYRLSTHAFLQITATLIIRSRHHHALFAFIFHMFRCFLYPASSNVSRPFSCPHVHIHIRKAASGSVSQGFDSHHLWLQWRQAIICAKHTCMHGIGPSLPSRASKEGSDTAGNASRLASVVQAIGVSARRGNPSSADML